MPFKSQTPSKGIPPHHARPQKANHKTLVARTDSYSSQPSLSTGSESQKSFHLLHDFTRINLKLGFDHFLGQHRANDLSRHVGQPEAAAVVEKGQALVIEPEQV